MRLFYEASLYTIITEFKVTSLVQYILAFYIPACSLLQWLILGLSRYISDKFSLTVSVNFMNSVVTHLKKQRLSRNACARERESAGMRIDVMLYTIKEPRQVRSNNFVMDIGNAATLTSNSHTQIIK